MSEFMPVKTVNGASPGAEVEAVCELREAMRLLHQENERLLEENQRLSRQLAIESQRWTPNWAPTYPGGLKITGSRLGVGDGLVRMTTGTALPESMP